MQREVPCSGAQRADAPAEHRQSTGPTRCGGVTNMGSIISSHNHRILKSEKKTVTPPRACNCDKPEDCPLKGHCMGVQCVVYKATISAPNHAEKYYYGLSEPEFKSRYANHKSSLKYPSKRNTTELSKYYWELRDKGVDKGDIKVDWRIERQAHKYKCGTRRCDLCLTEKLVIATADKSTMLNKRSEIISACPHRTKYRYHKVRRSKWNSHVSWCYVPNTDC